MLPAYPAFSILSALGLMKLVPEHRLRSGLRIADAGLLGLDRAGRGGMFPGHIKTGRRLRSGLSRWRLPRRPLPAERVAFYDAGQARYDELNQMQWYGDRYLNGLTDREKLLAELRSGVARVCVLDWATYNAWVASQHRSSGGGGERPPGLHPHGKAGCSMLGGEVAGGWSETENRPSTPACRETRNAPGECREPGASWRPGALPHSDSYRTAGQTGKPAPLGSPVLAKFAQ